MKRVVLIGDLHCGHMVGLTPPDWQYHPDFKRIQAAMWDFYARTIAALKPIDVLVVNGDAVDGKGHRSGGTEQFEQDMQEQAAIACRCIAEADAAKVCMTYGTPYHTGQDTDYELAIAREFNAEIKGHLFLDVNGVIFDVKHKVGSSTIPHGRHTQVAKEKLWADLWAEALARPKSQIIARSHVHYWDFNGDGRYLGMTLPALQGLGSKYGERQCSGVVNIGLVHFDITEKGEIIWNPFANAHLMELRLGASAPIKC